MKPAALLLTALAASLLFSILAFAQGPSAAKAPATQPATQPGDQESKPVPPVLNFTMKNIDGKEVPLSHYQGKVVLMVNVASRCGLTPQYDALEQLFEKYSPQGFIILGFPANNFGGQEPGSNDDIKKFCSTKYNVKFDLFSKISVKGDDIHPLYKFLTSKDTDPQFPGDITWNFEKFLISRDGKIIARFAPRTKPDAPEVVKAIEAEIAKTP